MGEARRLALIVRAQAANIETQPTSTQVANFPFPPLTSAFLLGGGRPLRTLEGVRVANRRRPPHPGETLSWLR